MLGRDDIILDHARAYWHEAGHVLVARNLEVPVAGVIYTNLKRRPDMRVSGTLATAYYFTRETNPVLKAAEQAEWVRHFGIVKFALRLREVRRLRKYMAPAEMTLEDGELIKSRTNGTRAIQDFLPQATQILTANATTLNALAARLIENGRRVLDKVGLNSVMPSQWELVITGEEIISICG